MVDNTSFIGKQVRVICATNTSYEGLSGLIVDETKNTFTMLVNNKKKIIFKIGTTFEVDKKPIQGHAITMRIENRIKRGK